MKTMLLIAGAAAVGLTAGVAQAVAHHRHHPAAMASAGRYAEPPQPIPYAMVDAYLKASPRNRLALLQNAGAATGASVNASATSAPMNNDTSAAQPPPAANTQPPAAAPTPPAAPNNPTPPTSNAPETQQQPQAQPPQ